MSFLCLVLLQCLPGNILGNNVSSLLTLLILVCKELIHPCLNKTHPK